MSVMPASSASWASCSTGIELALVGRLGEVAVVGRHARRVEATRTYHHPVVGEITLDWDALTSDAEPDQQRGKASA